MSLLGRLAGMFGSEIRSRGREYHRAGAVRITRHDANSVRAAVQGTRSYRVDLNWDEDDQDFEYRCNCPYAADYGDPCKHVWATLLAADEAGLLPGGKSSGKERGVDVESDVEDLAGADVNQNGEDEADDDDDGENGDVPDARFEHRPLSAVLRDYAQRRPPGASRTFGQRGANVVGESGKNDWKRELARLRQDMEAAGSPAAPVSWPEGRRLVYVVDAAGALEGHGLGVELATESRRPDGTWERAKPAKLPREIIDHLPDPVDRHIVQMLAGTRGESSYTIGFGVGMPFEDGYLPRRFTLPDAGYLTTLRAICDTGRGRVRRAISEASDIPGPLAWDDGPPWEFWLEVGRSPGGRNYVLGGSLRRGEQAAPLDQADVLLRGGVAFIDGTVARFEHFGAFDLVASIRDGMKLTVPGEHGDELLRTLFALPRLPKLDLPEELRVDEIAPDPKPRLKIRPPRRKGHNERLSAEVTFDYAGTLFASDEPAVVRYDAATRRVVRRNVRAEDPHLAKLFELGFKPPTGFAEQSGLSLAATKLPRIVRDLAAAGWHVEAEGKLYRSPGEFKLSVKSGIDWFELHGEVDFGGLSAPLPKLLEALRKGERFVALGDGTFGLLPEEWLAKYGALAALGEATEDHLQFSKRQVGFLDALLASMPDTNFDETYARARDALLQFEGVEPEDPPAGFTGTLRPYQRDGLGWMSFLRKFGFGGVLADDMGLGKAQPLDAKILTPGGWKRMGDIAVGDEVVSANGGTSRVLGVFPQGEKDIYRVTLSDGSATECCDEHLWQVISPVRKYRGAAPRVLSLREIREGLIDGSGNRRHFIPMVAPVEFPARELPLHPYLLGVLLGDGGIAHRVVLSSADAELLTHVESLLPAGVSMSYTGAGVDYRICSRGRGIVNVVADELRELGLMGCRSEAKFVPEPYKLAPVSDRIELLRGLLDTDGHVRPVDNNIEFCTVSPRLAEDVQFLVHSLGGTAPIRTKPTIGQLAYRMSIALPEGVQPFRLSRKSSVYHPREKYPPSRAVVSVEFVGRKPAQCIRVDAPDHLYVTDDFIVTHNTVQVLALLESRRLLRGGLTSGEPGSNSASANEAIGPSLVVVPKSLVFNWKAEALKFSPALRVLDHTGAERERASGHFELYDLILTTYGTLRRDAELFKDVRFDYVILDEAQAIKNASTGAAKAARLLRGDHRLALSGTPVQNHLGELWSLFEFLNPGMMGAASVFKLTPQGAAAMDADSRAVLSRALRPFILRRTKEQVATELPEKLEQTLFCEMDEAQRKLYDELRDHYRQSLMERVMRDGINKSKIQVLEALLRLRQAACHPGLIDKSREKEPSAKLDALLEQIAQVVDEDHKVLVFSQFTSLLAIVRHRLDADGIPYEYLDGKTRDREARVNRFQTDPNCKLFLISLKAGGLGLNLTAAEYVYLLDPWWNPAVEAQAIDRAHRIGQTRRVFAYRLIARGTVEEKVLALQQTKRDLADAIINADNSLIGKLGREDLELLLS